VPSAASGRLSDDAAALGVVSHAIPDGSGSEGSVVKFKIMEIKAA
jgi:hypothetical protein